MIEDLFLVCLLARLLASLLLCLLVLVLSVKFAFACWSLCCCCMLPLLQLLSHPHSQCIDFYEEVASLLARLALFLEQYLGFHADSVGCFVRLFAWLVCFCVALPLLFFAFALCTFALAPFVISLCFWSAPVFKAAANQRSVVLEKRCQAASRGEEFLLKWRAVVSVSMHV